VSGTEPRQAATVLLLRDAEPLSGGPAALEVYLLRRT
jgi:hypothetical protein